MYFCPDLIYSNSRCYRNLQLFVSDSTFLTMAFVLRPVPINELIWRIRMKHRKNETMQLLQQYVN